MNNNTLSLPDFITQLEYKKFQAETVMSAFDDARIKMIETNRSVTVRYSSIKVNGACDKADFAWISNEYYVRPHAGIPYNFQEMDGVIAVHSQPYQIKIAETVIGAATIPNYASFLTENNFNKHVIRMIDIELASCIMKNQWKVDMETLNDRVRTFLTFS